ncbi:hypothetical protein [Shewanella sp. YLB-07]|uniref:hypothetical protein n=1 Tax=Shewanella sp. YLB-07 TaxID=2601268 RepID=UPI001883C024|nr:hypothetical protein [Shewanella sp. YLB-07]
MPAHQAQINLTLTPSPTGIHLTMETNSIKPLPSRYHNDLGRFNGKAINIALTSA